MSAYEQRYYEAQQIHGHEAAREPGDCHDTPYLHTFVVDTLVIKRNPRMTDTARCDSTHKTPRRRPPVVLGRPVVTLL
jgi:hypothetical protein